jgi:hypothetical protein
VYIAGTALHIGILHSVALLGVVGKLITTLMAAELGDSDELARREATPPVPLIGLGSRPWDVAGHADGN